jgi:hypothetical protein
MKNIKDNNKNTDRKATNEEQDQPVYKSSNACKFKRNLFRINDTRAWQYLMWYIHKYVYLVLYNNLSRYQVNRITLTE